MISFIARYMKLILFKKKWRKLNRHNSTNPGNIFPADLGCV